MLKQLSLHSDRFRWNFLRSKTLTYGVKRDYALQHTRENGRGWAVKAKNDWLWQPPGETIEAIATVLGAHWAAAKSQQWPLFSLGAGSWASRLPWRARLTTAQEAADSSDTLPDPHPC